MKILFPTDFSEAADHAYIYALRLADVLAAEINIVHVYDLPSLKALMKKKNGVLTHDVGSYASSMVCSIVGHVRRGSGHHI